MGLFNNQSEGNYVKSYSIPSMCKDEKAHFDTSDHVQEKVQTKPRTERKQKTEPTLEVKPKTTQEAAPKVKPKTTQEAAPKVKPKVSQAPIQPVTFNNSQSKGCFNQGKAGCIIIIFIAFVIRSCVEEVINTFSSGDNNDTEVVYDTTRYDYGHNPEEPSMMEEPIDSINMDDIVEEF